MVLSFGAGAASLSVLVFGLCATGLAQTPWLLLAAAVARAFARPNTAERAAVAVLEEYA